MNGEPRRTRVRAHVICTIGELQPGTMKLVPIGKFGIGVYNVDGALYAITNYCPHEGGPLCLGRLHGTTFPDESRPSRMVYVLEGRILRCPWHQWEFDLATGRTIARPERGIRTYPVRVENGNVVLFA